MSITTVLLTEPQVKSIRTNPALDEHARRQIAGVIETLAIAVDRLRVKVGWLDADVHAEKTTEAEYADPEDDDCGGYDDLLSSIPANKELPAHDQVRWVFDSLSTPYLQIDPATVPGRSALRMLKWARGSEENYNRFLSHVWSKLPTI